MTTVMPEICVSQQHSLSHGSNVVEVLDNNGENCVEHEETDGDTSILMKHKDSTEHSTTSREMPQDSAATQHAKKLARTVAVSEENSHDIDGENVRQETEVPSTEPNSCSNNLEQVEQMAPKINLMRETSFEQSATENGMSQSYSRDSSFDGVYTDATGTDLEDFFVKTLNKSKPDRTFLLQLEKDMIEFIRDPSLESRRFIDLSSYHRMLVHRVAAFMGLDHNVESSSLSIFVKKTAMTRIPDFRFSENLMEEFTQGQPKKLILKRDVNSMDDSRGLNGGPMDSRKSRSLEEREEAYNQVRSRIFKDGQEGYCDYIAGARPPDGIGQWNSFGVAQYPGVPGAVTVLTRANAPPPTSQFSAVDSSKPGAESSIAVPISSMPSVNPSADNPADRKVMAGISNPNNTGCPPVAFTDETGQQLYIWVATILDQIPAGSFIIDPSTGRPYLNADNSVYRWFPPARPSAESTSATDCTTGAASDVTGLRKVPDTDQVTLAPVVQAMSLSDLSSSTPKQSSSNRYAEGYQTPQPSSSGTTYYTPQGMQYLSQIPGSQVVYVSAVPYQPSVDGSTPDWNQGQVQQSQYIQMYPGGQPGSFPYQQATETYPAQSPGIVPVQDTGVQQAMMAFTPSIVAMQSNPYVVNQSSANVPVYPGMATGQVNSYQGTGNPAVSQYSISGQSTYPAQPSPMRQGNLPSGGGATFSNPSSTPQFVSFQTYSPHSPLVVPGCQRPATVVPSFASLPVGPLQQLGYIPAVGQPFSAIQLDPKRLSSYDGSQAKSGSRESKSGSKSGPMDNKGTGNTSHGSRNMQKDMIRPSLNKTAPQAAAAALDARLIGQTLQARPVYQQQQQQQQQSMYKPRLNNMGHSKSFQSMGNDPASSQKSGRVGKAGNTGPRPPRMPLPGQAQPNLGQTMPVSSQHITKNM